MGNRRGQGISRAWGIGGVAVVAGGVLLLAGLALGEARSEVPANAGSVPQLPTSSPSATTKPLRIAAVGDSITQGNSPDFSAGMIGDGSWVSYALGDGVTFAGGWALGGVPTRTMVENVTPYPDVDVLVLLAGVNDYGQRVPFDATTENFDAIVATVAPEKVLVSSVPPRDADPALAVAFNSRLEELASARGWSYVDGSAGVRDVDNRYLEGLTKDGVHPTAEAAKIIGTGVREALLPLR